MKKILILSTAIFMNACCIFTSQDCECEPPDPALNEETIKWITPYDGQDYFIFKNDLGSIDSLHVKRTSDTEFCGGDECGNDCEVERAELISKNNPNLKFTTSAKEVRFLQINNIDDQQNLIFVELNILNNDIYSSSENTTVSVIDTFEWKNQSIKVLKIECENGLNCLDYPMKKMIISQDYGLLKYESNNGQWWNKAN